MQWLMQVSDQVGEQEQRLFLVLDRERERWRHRLVRQHGDCCADSRDQVVLVLSLEISVKAVPLDS